MSDCDFSPYDNTIDTYSIDERIEDLRNELETLENLKDEAGSEWDGGMLINDGYFKDYAQELASDLGLIDEAADWPNAYIDWDAAADALQMDYTPVEYDGITFWIRS